MTQLVGTFVVVYGWFMAPTGWRLALMVWAYALAFFLLASAVKFAPIASSNIAPRITSVI